MMAKFFKFKKIKRKANRIISDFMVLIKFRVVLLSTLSGVTGFIVASSDIDRNWMIDILVFMGSIFLLASGSAALNQYQERILDGLMERTRSRPLPSFHLRPKTALIISLLFILAGEIGLFLIFGKIPAVLGLLAVILYNGMYTYLKRITPFASIPGALIGAILPAMGWTSAGGPLLCLSLCGIMLFFYLWQVPHFWILAGIHSHDYSNAGFPSLSDIFSPSQLNRIIFIWIIATACSSLLLPLFGMLQHPVSIILMSVSAIWISFDALLLFKPNGELKKESSAILHSHLKNRFIRINIFALCVMLILIFDHGIRL